MKVNNFKAGLLILVTLLVACNQDSEVKPEQKQQDLNFIDSVVVEKELVPNYLTELNELSFSGLSQKYVFVQKYSDAPTIIEHNQGLVNTLSIEQIKSDYDTFVMSFKTLNYQKYEESKNPLLLGYKPTKKQLENIKEKHDVMIALVGQLQNEMLRKTAGDRGLWDKNKVDLSNQQAIAGIEDRMSKLILDNDSLIEIIDVKFPQLQARLENRNDFFRGILDSYLGHDLLKLRLANMDEKDEKRPDVEKQLQYILKVKDNGKKYFEYIYLKY